jgi:hypothetical protein
VLVPNGFVNGGELVTLTFTSSHSRRRAPPATTIGQNHKKPILIVIDEARSKPEWQLQAAIVHMMLLVEVFLQMVVSRLERDESYEAPYHPRTILYLCPV